MNKIISVPSQPIANVSTTSARSQLEAERVREMLTLLTSLMAREEATIKLIIDCLYDIGYINLINKPAPSKDFSNWLRLSPNELSQQI